MQARNTPRRNYRKHFEFDAFLSAVEAERKARKMSWRQIGKETGISPSSLTRLAQGKRLDIDGLIALSSWAGVEMERYYTNERVEPAVSDTVHEMAALLRGDPNLTPQDAEHLENLLRSSYEFLSHAERRKGPQS